MKATAQNDAPVLVRPHEQLAAVEAESREIQQQLDALEAQFVDGAAEEDRLQRHVKQLVEQARVAGGSLEQLRAERESLRLRIAELEQRALEVTDELRAVEQDVQQTRQQLASRREAMGELDGQWQSLRDRLRELEEQRSKLVAQRYQRSPHPPAPEADEPVEIQPLSVVPPQLEPLEVIPPQPEPLEVRPPQPEPLSVVPPGAESVAESEAESEAESVAEAVPATQAVAETPAAGVPLAVEITADSEHNLYVGIDGDVRQGGVFLAMVELLAMGTRVQLTMLLPKGHRVEATGEVAWQREMRAFSDEPEGVGVRFDALGDREAQVLQAFTRYREPLLYDADW